MQLRDAARALFWAAHNMAIGPAPSRLLFLRLASCGCAHARRGTSAQEGLVKLTIFLGGGAIAAEEIEFAHRAGAPWVYMPCK